jgi:aminoglycoside phosphotransferase (APT) family kinase protein
MANGNMSNGLYKMEKLYITAELARKLIKNQFPEFAHLDIQPVKIQGHDNRTFCLGSDVLIRMPTAESYALKVPKEQNLLPQLAPLLTIAIPIPLTMGHPSEDFPFPFSIYKWLDGESANCTDISDINLEGIALNLANFLKELQEIDTSFGPTAGEHNWYRGAHISVYDQQARNQIEQLAEFIDHTEAVKLWNKALSTKWHKPPVWIHGDFAPGNILIQENKLVGVIDFGGMGIGDPACDLVIAWTFLHNKAREIFKHSINMDQDTWLRARAWCLWKATFELCHLTDQNSADALKQKRIIMDVLEGGI